MTFTETGAHGGSEDVHPTGILTSKWKLDGARVQQTFLSHYLNICEIFPIRHTRAQVQTLSGSSDVFQFFWDTDRSSVLVMRRGLVGLSQPSSQSHTPWRRL